MRAIAKNTKQIVELNEFLTMQSGTNKVYTDYEGNSYTQKELDFIYSDYDVKLMQNRQELSILLMPSIISLKPDNCIEENVALALAYADEMIRQLNLFKPL